MEGMEGTFLDINVIQGQFASLVQGRFVPLNVVLRLVITHSCKYSLTRQKVQMFMQWQFELHQISTDLCTWAWEPNIYLMQLTANAVGQEITSALHILNYVR